jgi:predicted short-subunit dehydrogenase-like oxidoreductase (DUF2520 family)
VAILGCGHVGRALAVELLDAERPPPLRGKLLLWSRSKRSVQGLRKLLIGQEGGNELRLQVCASAGEALSRADVVLLCVADGALASMVRELAREPTGESRPVVFFTNGYLSLATLAPLKRRGFPVGRLHPLTPIPSGMELSNLIRAPFALEGEAQTLRAARALVAGIEGRVLALKPGAAPGYHAAASLLAGGLVALFDQAERVMATALRSSRANLRDALTDYADTVLLNLFSLGPSEALTGALSRGSEAIVRGHLKALGKAPGAHALYCLLGERMLELAQARGSIDARQKHLLLGLLEARSRARAARLRDRSAKRSS